MARGVRPIRQLTFRAALQGVTVGIMHWQGVWVTFALLVLGSLGWRKCWCTCLRLSMSRRSKIHMEDVRRFKSRLMEYTIHILTDVFVRELVAWYLRPVDTCSEDIFMPCRYPVLVQNDRRMEETGSGVDDSGMTQELQLTAARVAALFCCFQSWYGSVNEQVSETPSPCLCRGKA